MATWTTVEKTVWEFADNKLGFEAWIEADSEREKAWLKAAQSHGKWRTENPDSDHSDNPHNDAAGEIVDAWIAYAEAKKISK